MASASTFTTAEIGQFTLFAGLSDAAIADLQKHMRSLHIGRGAVVIEYGGADSDVYLLFKGQLLAKRFSADGHEVGFRRIMPPAYFGELAALGGGPRSVSVMAFTDARIGAIAARDFNAMVAEWPTLAATLLSDLASRVRELSDRLFESATVNVAGRVAAELIRMALAADAAADGGVVPDVPTHAEMAARVGGQRETVTRAFNRLVKSNIVARRGRNLIIRDFEALLAETG